MSMMTIRTKSSVFIIAMALSISSAAAPSVHSSLQASVSSAIDIPPVMAGEAKRAITLDDMLSLREVHEPRQSPDRRRVAFLVKQAFRSCDCYRTALYVTLSEEGATAEKLVEEDYIANLQWMPDGHSISYLASRGGSAQLWTLNLATRRISRVFVHAPNHEPAADRAFVQSVYLPTGILDYRWSPDGTRVAFTAEAMIDPSLAAMAAKDGFRYDDEKMIAWDLVAGDWASAHQSKQLWLYDVRRKSERFLWSTPDEWSTSITSLLWSPSGRKLAFSYASQSGFGSDSISVVDTASARVSPMGSAEGSIGATGAAWSSDEQRIAYLVRLYSSSFHELLIVSLLDGSRKKLASDLYAGHIPWLAWDTDQHRIMFLSEGLGLDRRQTGIYSIPEVGGAAVRLTDTTGKVDECDVILQASVACVWQSPSAVPRPSLVSTTTGSIKKLTDVNPEMAGVELAPIEELHWKNSDGNDTNGFLITPMRRAATERVPLVVIGYSFSGEYVTKANSTLTTYPAQAFARDGMAVLLFNQPRHENWKDSDFRAASKALGYGPLASIQAVVGQLDARGLIDPKRVGMMGHSLAGFWVQLAVTQTKLFKAVEIHNGGTFSEPGTYWINGSKPSRELQEHDMGGPPFGVTLSNYLGFSMSLNADRISAPVLMEYDALEALSAMQYYEAMQHYGVPVEFYIYPNDNHSTERPEHRMFSMQRNLDWFEFWLLGKATDDQSKIDQYSRWSHLKEKLDAHTIPDGG